jgi:hypothetical protein
MLSLCDAFGLIPDPRFASGRRFSLQSLLMLLLAGLLSGRHSLAQISLWGRSLGKKTRQLLGFHGAVPCVATLSNTLRRLDIESVESHLSRYVLGGNSTLKTGTHLALDGKVLRSSHDQGVPLVHLLSAFAVNVQGVVGQLRLEPQENEITASLKLLASLPLEGAVVTGDAIFAQKKYVP